MSRRGSLPCRPSEWGAVVYLGVVGGALALWLWTLALELTTPTRVAVTVTANPVVASGLGLAVLGEPVAVSLLAGLAGVLVGIALTAWPAHPMDPGM